MNRHEDTVLDVQDLSVRFFTNRGVVNAVEQLHLEVRQGEVYGVVGESGSGKSVTALSIMDLIEEPGRIVDGEIWYRNESLAEEFYDREPDAVDGPFVDLLRVPSSVRRSLRGSSFSMIFQDPMSSFDPTSTVGKQVAEAVEVQRRAASTSEGNWQPSQGYGLGDLLLGAVSPSHRFVTRESRERAVELLDLVGIPDPIKQAGEYPHQFSGGMLQRAMIAMALAGEPDILIADEPTTALDVTIQAQILRLLDQLREEQRMSVMLITHDLGVIARMCDRVGVMYAGEVVERGTLSDIFEDNVHPYTRGLLASVPDLDRSDPIEPIPGNVPSLLDHEMERRCYFVDRCPNAMEMCLEKPPEFNIGDGTEHQTRCYLAEHEYAEKRALATNEAGTAGE
jgi:peptide/nickel transport system ATP-binding protein